MASVPVELLVAADECGLSTTGTKTRTLADLFDNEALWNADETDDYILTIAGEVATSLDKPLIELVDTGDNSLLHMAAIWNRPKAMEALIRRGIELNDKNASGNTPLDLATHYGNVDLALQLRHYGAKHTCESERDLAVAQRDLAQQQLRDMETDLADALRRLKGAKQEREELRIDRDQLVLENISLTNQRDTVVTEMAKLELVVSALTKDKQQMLLQMAQIREALACESDARLNATQSWHATQQVVAELQDRELSFRAREVESNRLRDEARTDRDVARELARLAQLDLGQARQAQLEAEHVRDAAVSKQIDAENVIAADKELWMRRIAKTEHDRKHIQIEIDRQTDVLRKECDRLEKQLRTATTLTWTVREELADKVANATRLESKVLYLESTVRRNESARDELERHVAVLEEAQHSEHKLWRDRFEKTLRDEAADAMRRIVCEVAVTAEKVVAQDQTLRDLARATRREVMLQPEMTKSLFLDGGRSLSPVTPRTKPTTMLPLLPDRSVNVTGNTTSTPLLASPSPSILVGTNEPTIVSVVEDSVDIFDLCPAPTDMTAIISTARAATHLDRDHFTFGGVADLVVALAEAVRKNMEDVASFISRNWRHFRMQVQALEKMVERKDELISRFNQHRRDKPKKQSARLRECMYRPQI